MGRDDWCSQKGWKARAEGITHEESRCKKISIAVFFSACAIVCLVIGSIELSHGSNALAITDDYVDLQVTNSYDACKYPAYVLEASVSPEEVLKNGLETLKYCNDDNDCLKKGTNWVQTWTYNGSIMIIMSVNFIVMAFGGCFFFPRYCGTITNCCFACCCHSSAISVAMTAIYSPFGIACSWNTAPSQYNGDSKFNADGYTYADEASLIGTFAIIQSIMCLGQCFCCCFPLLSTPVAEGKPKSTKKKVGVIYDENSVIQMTNTSNLPMYGGNIPTDMSNNMSQSAAYYSHNQQPVQQFGQPVFGQPVLGQQLSYAQQYKTQQQQMSPAYPKQQEFYQE